jgi:hypothetical protein
VQKALRDGDCGRVEALPGHASLTSAPPERLVAGSKISPPKTRTLIAGLRPFGGEPGQHVCRIALTTGIGRPQGTAGLDCEWPRTLTGSAGRWRLTRGGEAGTLHDPSSVCVHQLGSTGRKHRLAGG